LKTWTFNFEDVRAVKRAFSRRWGRFVKNKAIIGVALAACASTSDEESVLSKNDLLDESAKSLTSR